MSFYDVNDIGVANWLIQMIWMVLIEIQIMIYTLPSVKHVNTMGGGTVQVQTGLFLHLTMLSKLILNCFNFMVSSWHHFIHWHHFYDFYVPAPKLRQPGSKTWDRDCHDIVWFRGVSAYNTLPHLVKQKAKEKSIYLYIYISIIHDRYYKCNWKSNGDLPSGTACPTPFTGGRRHQGASPFYI